MGVNGELRVMTSSGGLATPEMIAERPRQRCFPAWSPACAAAPGLARTPAQIAS
jgi:hypothetical protein